VACALLRRTILSGLESEKGQNRPCQSLLGAAGSPLKADVLAGSRHGRVGPEPIATPFQTLSQTVSVITELPVGRAEIPQFQRWRKCRRRASIPKILQHFICRDKQHLCLCPFLRSRAGKRGNRGHFSRQDRPQSPAARSLNPATEPAPRRFNVPTGRAGHQGRFDAHFVLPAFSPCK
jgi:hypothetical protein